MPEYAVADNIINKVAKNEGIKNRNDILDLSTVHDPGLLEIGQQINNAEYKIDMQVQEKTLDENKQAMARNLRGTLEELSDAFKSTMWELLQDRSTTRTELSDKLFDLIKKRGFDMPRFTVMNPEAAKQYLHDVAQYNEPLDPDSFVTVFNLPKPLAQYWKKGGTEFWGQASEKVGEDIVEWGRFYRSIMPVVWKSIEHQNNEQNLNFQRLDLPRSHNPKEYYYIWEVSDPNNIKGPEKNYTVNDLVRKFGKDHKQSEEETKEKRVAEIKETLAQYTEETS